MQELFWFVLPIALAFTITGRTNTSLAANRLETRSSFDVRPTPCS